MGYFNGNLAREVARLTGWEDKVWSRRYQAILVTDEETAQVERLKYLLENSCKEGLVDSPIHWPGVHCAKALITGVRVEGTWFDRKHEHNARLRGKEPGPREFASTEEVILSQLPCWSHLEPEAYRLRMSELVREIEEAAAAEHQETGKEPLGEEGVRAQDPETLFSAPILGGSPGDREGAAGGGGRSCPGSGDPSKEDQEVASPVRRRSDQGGAQGDVGGLRLL